MSARPNGSRAPIQRKMKKSLLALIVLATLTVVGCTTTTTSSTGTRDQGSGVRDAGDINAGPAAGAAASGPIGHPGL